MTIRAACVAAGCWSRDTETVAGVTLCRQHLDGLRAALTPPVQLVERVEPYADLVSVVYYATFDQGVTVKIGWSAAPGQRFGELTSRGRRGPAELLAARPGGRETETLVHRRLKHLRLTGEFFQLDDEVRQHIAKVQARWPDWRAMVDALNARHAPVRRRRKRPA